MAFARKADFKCITQLEGYFSEYLKCMIKQMFVNEAFNDDSIISQKPSVRL